MQLTTPFFLFLGLFALLWTGPRDTGRQDDPHPSTDELVAADRAFLADTTEHGLEGWLSWFAEDAIVLKVDGAAVRGSAELHDYYARLPGFPPAGFRWDPKRSGVAGSADLGWTAGTYATAQEKDAGRYLTVWVKQEDGSWKALTDLGGDPGFRTQLAHMDGPPDESSTKALASRISQSGDLAVSTGTWTARRDERAVRGRYLSVWERSADGVWSVVTEIGVLDR